MKTFDFSAHIRVEGIDQTRGWFYSLIAVSTLVTGKAPYKNVLVNDLVLDKYGKKMSKSRGNTVEPMDLFDRYGVDALRWYLLYVSPVWTPTRFDEDGLKEVLSKFIGTIKNVYTFFALYANTDSIKPQDFFVEYGDRPELDRWILSKYNNLVKYVTESMDVYDHNKSVRAIQNFVNEDLSNWYIRRSRRRFWETELTEDKKAVYNTTYEVLVGLSQLIAPFAPYLSEELYRNLTGEESVHLSYYPKTNEDLIDENIEKRMDLVKDIVSLGRASRENAKIKVRQPIQKIHIDGKYQELIDDLVPLIKEELNVKEVVFEHDLNEFMDFTLKPNFKVAGPMLGSKVKEFTGILAKADALEIITKIQSGEKYELDVKGQILELDDQLLDIRISAKEGYDVATGYNLFTIIDTNLSDELLNEGYAREFISKVQQMRKNNGYEMMDRIKIFYTSSPEIDKAVKDFQDYIKEETLAFAHSMKNILKKLYDNKYEISEAVHNHTEFFNTEPNIGAPILGYIISLEEKRRKTKQSFEDISYIKKGMMGISAGLGDSFTQVVLAPLFISMAVMLSLDNSFYPALIPVIILAALILFISYTGFMNGYFKGKEFMLQRIKNVKESKVKIYFPYMFSGILGLSMSRLLLNNNRPYENIFTIFIIILTSGISFMRKRGER
jgi:valyl-tRNA synthetase